MSLTSNNNMTPAELLQLNLNDSTLDLLNAAIASHQVKNENALEQQKFNNSNTESTDTTSTKKPVAVHTKRELDKDEKTATTAPKRAGRKPLDKTHSDAPLDPKQKRKAQNRAAQRAFRDRKEKHVAELQARIDELEALNATKDEDLLKENQRLKEMLQKVQEENYALKGAQFTFEFPLNDHLPTTTATTAATTTNNNTVVNMKNTNDAHNLYQNTSGSSMSSGNSYSGEDVSSSAEHSPLSNTHTHEDDSTASADTPTGNNSLFSTEPMQFGAIYSDSNALEFLGVSDNGSGLGNGFTTTNNFPTSDFPTGDLFHGKDDLFTNYRVPISNTNDDFLFANEDLTGLFGGTDDLFGFNNNFNTQFGLPETPATRRYNLTAEKKQCLVDHLRKGQQEGKYIHQVHKEIEQKCPEFNLDALCDDLKKKAKCSLSTFPITDHDVDAFVKCFDHGN